MVALVLIVYLLGMFVLGFGPVASITLGYLVLAVYETVHPYNLFNKKESIFKHNPFKSKTLNLAVLSTALLVIGSIVIPFPAFQNALGITSLTWYQWLFGLGVGFLVVPLAEIYKFFYRKKSKKSITD